MALSQFKLAMAAAFGPALAGDDIRSFTGDSPTGGVTTLGGILTHNASLLVPLINAKIDVVSDDSADDLGSTGAEYVTLEGIDANNAEISEIVEMNGGGVVTTDATFKALNRAYVSQVGSGKVNAGIITASITSGAVIGGMKEGFMEMSIGSFTVPAGKQAIPYEVSLDLAFSATQADTDTWTVELVKIDASGLRTVIGFVSNRRDGGSFTRKVSKQERIAAGDSLALVELLGTGKRLRAECQFLLRDA
jgi:hypothetical protein